MPYIYKKIHKKKALIVLLIPLAFLIITHWKNIIFISAHSSYNQNYFYISLIENLSQKNIIRTPLKAFTQDQLKSLLPGKELTEANKNNPYLIKRKFKIDKTHLKILYSPPESIYKFNIRLLETPLFEFGYGTSGEEVKNLKFIIQIRRYPTNDLLLEKSYTPKISNFLYKEKISLSFIKNQRIILYLITEGDNDQGAFWFQPIIYEPNQSENNIILISLDTLRADHLSIYGYHRKTSPNIDALAKDSIIFYNAIAPSSWTLPSHMSLMTSLYSIHHNVKKEDNILKPSIITLAQILSTNKFYCAGFTGGGFLSAHYGFSRGFDFYQENPNDALSFDAARKLASQAINFLNYNKDKKFFLFLHTYQIHNPYFSPPPYNKLFSTDEKQKVNMNVEGILGGKESYFKPLPNYIKENIISLYDGEIRYTDEILIKRIIEELKKLKLYDRSLIIITSDHGEEFYEHKAWLHGHDLYNEIIRIPLIIKLPHSEHKSKVINTFVSLIDIFPTILSIAKINYSNYKIDGENLIPLILGKAKSIPIIYSEVDENIVSLHNTKKIAAIKQNEKIIYNEPYSYESAGFFSFAPPERLKIEFYDLEADPNEKSNIYFRKSSSATNIFNIVKALYINEKKIHPEKVPLSKELIEELKSLGYLK